MNGARKIRLKVNGVAHEALVEPRLLLADFLRGELGLGGVHVGCEHGVCGACTILMNGQAVRSCIMLAVQADGADLTTVEGLSPRGQLHPIQQAFMEGHGLQCGFCTPGFLMSIYELLQENQNPSDDEIKQTLGGNLCRCTGYQDILGSIRLAVRDLQEARNASGAHQAPLGADAR